MFSIKRATVSTLSFVDNELENVWNKATINYKIKSSCETLPLVQILRTRCFIDHLFDSVCQTHATRNQANHFILLFLFLFLFSFFFFPPPVSGDISSPQRERRVEDKHVVLTLLLDSRILLGFLDVTL